MLQSYPLPLTIDKERLEQTLEALPLPDHYFEVMARTRKTQKLFSAINRSRVFPAARRIFETDNYTLARVWVGADLVSAEQFQVIKSLYMDDVIVEYTHIKYGKCISEG